MEDRHIQALEDFMGKCFHCGTPLEPWRPAIYDPKGNGVQIGWQETPHKWCRNCCWVIFRIVKNIMGLNNEARMGEQDTVQPVLGASNS